MKTTLAKKGSVSQDWYIIDASKEILGRMAVKIATILRGRNKPLYTPNADAGDFVIVINADKVKVTGKKETDKDYMFFGGYVGRERHQNLASMRARRPDYIIKHAVKGMLPQNRLADRLLTKLKVYRGAEHPHAAQNPKPLN